MKIIKQGAESIIYLSDNNIIKERIKKNYRIKEIDLIKRKYPTRREAKLLEKAKQIGVNVPNVIKVDDKNMKVLMEFINGSLVKEVLDDLNKGELKKTCIEIGKEIAKLHNNDIIHNDLTTSNMLIKENKVYFIDFGLGFISNKLEDKAVDLHLLKQALESKHYKCFKEAFNSILKGYKKCHQFDEVLKRLEKVESRGRYKKKK